MSARAFAHMADHAMLCVIQSRNHAKTLLAVTIDIRFLFLAGISESQGFRDESLQERLRCLMQERLRRLMCGRSLTFRAWSFYFRGQAPR